MNQEHPHGGMPLLRSGAALEHASAAMILIHGRGASAEDIMMLAHQLGRSDFAYFAPQASGNTWYPFSFLNPTDQNEPGISSGMRVIAQIFSDLESGGISPNKIMIGGFSQGACLATEYIARNAKRYGGVFGLSGGLIGPENTPRDYSGSLEDTPVFLGCSDVDFHIPKERVQETTRVLTKLGGLVTERLYPGMGHTVNMDELKYLQQMMDGLVGS